MLEMMKKHLANYTAGNWDAYKAELASDAIYEEVATRQRVQGADEYLKAIQRWKRAFPDLKATVVGGFAAGDRGVAEIEWEGTQSGPLEGPFGTIQPTNKHGRIRAVIVVTMKNGKIAETHHYFDVMTVLGQLGIAPMAGAAAQPPAKAAPVPPTRH